MAMLGLRCARGLSLAVACRLFAAVFLLLRSMALSRRLSQQLRLAGSTQAQQPWSTGLAASQHVGSFQTRSNTCPLLLAGEFLTPGPPGKHWSSLTNSNLLMFLEKEMAPHSSILAWKISWTEEPGGLQSMGSQRVGHDGAMDTLWCSGYLVFVTKTLTYVSSRLLQSSTLEHVTSCVLGLGPQFCPSNKTQF